MSVKTERVTILTTLDFKAFLNTEATREGVSVSELIRERCLNIPSNGEDELVLKAMVEQVNESTQRAKEALNKGLRDARKTLKELKQARIKQ